MNIVLADDHVLVRNGIKALLEEEDIHVINEASNGKEAIEVIKDNLPDILVVDINMPVLNGIEVVKTVKKKYPDLKVMVLSMHDSEEYVLESIAVGADGYLLKGSSKDEFIKALTTIASGSKYFSGDISAIIVNNLANKKETNINNNTTEATEVENYHLTKREKQILKLILKGMSNKEIAEALAVSKRTTEVHRFNLMKKLRVKNLIELSNKASHINFKI